jgi:NADP-dependent 3-hydroxy acid dehydrogenase YdfG
VDVTDPDAVARAAALVHQRFGRVDLLVNAAGVMLPNPLAAGRRDEWSRMVDTNLTGVLHLIDAFREDLVGAAAAGRTADLVNVSSIGAHVAFPAYAVYGATKAAVTQLSAALRTEFGPLDVRVTNIEPGLTETELGQQIDNPELSEQLSGMLRAIPPLTAEDVADLIAWTTSRRPGVNLRQAVVLPTRQA